MVLQEEDRWLLSSTYLGSFTMYMLNFVFVGIVVFLIGDFGLHKKVDACVCMVMVLWCIFKFALACVFRLHIGDIMDHLM